MNVTRTFVFLWMLALWCPVDLSKVYHNSMYRCIQDWAPIIHIKATTYCSFINNSNGFDPYPLGCGPSTLPLSHSACVELLTAHGSLTQILCLCTSELGGPVYFHWTTLLTSCNMGFKYTIPGTPGLILSPKTRIVGERWIGYSKLSCDMNVMITPVFLWTLIHLGAVDLYRIYQTSQDIVVFRAWPLSST